MVLHSYTLQIVASQQIAMPKKALPLTIENVGGVAKLCVLADDATVTIQRQIFGKRDGDVIPEDRSPAYLGSWTAAGVVTHFFW